MSRKTLAVPNWVDSRPYQRDAIRSWAENGGRGIFNMATGTGKTVTALLAAAQAASTLDELVVVIAVPYQHLVDQWADDVRDFGVKPIRAYRSRRRWERPLQRQLSEFRSDARDVIVAIVTHTTFAGEPFQRSLSRTDAKTMLIADEVHHLGAPHLREAFPEYVPLRLGLSATPERWYDEEGTETLFEYFGGIVYEYGLEAAIDSGALCPYYYIPHVVQLTADETEEYLALSRTIGRLANSGSGDGDLADADLQQNTSLKHALFKRARIVGTAENKLARLTELVEARESVEHTLVYCGDGSVEDDMDGETRRHVDATVQRLADLDVDAHRFTARESQAEREQLLDSFERGELDALVAIRCLDEGVDIPATHTAYMLASSSNPRQFVQRRGRILRTYPGKDHAVIHDFIAIPGGGLGSLESEAFNAERTLIEKELQRVSTFADAAMNHPDADVPGVPSGQGSLRELKRIYNLRDK